jgi:hypothetical protein
VKTLELLCFIAQAALESTSDLYLGNLVMSCPSEVVDCSMDGQGEDLVDGWKLVLSGSETAGTAAISQSAVALTQWWLTAPT